MAVPKYDEMYNDFLKIIYDKKEHDIREIRKKVAKMLHLSEEDLKEKLNSGKNKYYNRIGWTATYLKKANLINSTKRGMFIITKEGERVCYKYNINNEFLMQYENFRNFKSRNNINNMNEKIDEVLELTPQERIEEAIKEINEELEENLLEEVKKQEFIFLENLAVKLMVKMGYGDKNNSYTTQPINDGGIDGVIFEDELGINKILIQTKLYKKGEKVSRPEMQKFKGAIGDYGAKEGVFFTTSKFTSTALESAKKSNIITIDGEKLVKLMVKYKVGCYIDDNYEMKKIDLDFFENE